MVRPVKAAKWAAPVLPVLKQDRQLRICCDFKITVNLVALAETYPVPYIDYLLTKLKGGVKFTKLDLKDAYQ